MYDGTDWTARGLDTNLVSVSCPLTSFCFAIDGAMSYVTYNGVVWTKHATIRGRDDVPIAVSCLSSRWCMTVDVGGHEQSWSS